MLICVISGQNPVQKTTLVRIVMRPFSETLLRKRGSPAANSRDAYLEGRPPRRPIPIGEPHAARAEAGPPNAVFVTTNMLVSTFG